MTTARPRIPEKIVDARTIEALLDLADDFVAVHEPVLDADGRIIDARLRWWNASYRNLRLSPVTVGQSMRANYFNSDDAISHLSRAWERHRHEQVFVLDENSAHQYRPGGQAVHLLVVWLRIGDLVVEVCRDRSELRALSADIAEHRSTIRQAFRENARMSERAERVHGVHIDVITRLERAASELRSDRANAETAAEALDEVIAVLQRYSRR